MTDTSDTSQSEPLADSLSVRNLSCFRDERFLFQHLSFDVVAGQLILLSGENGSGKTSLIKLLCGILHPDAGEVYFDKIPVIELGEHYYQSLCYLGHLPGIKGDFTVMENIRFNQSMHNAVDDAAINDAVRQVGLNGFQNSMAANLSAGQKRRVALARLVVDTSPLWILDEPLTALDVKGVAWFESLLQTHLARGGMVVMTTHQPLADPALKPIIVQLGKKQESAS